MYVICAAVAQLSLGVERRLKNPSHSHKRFNDALECVSGGGLLGVFCMFSFSNDDDDDDNTSPICDPVILLFNGFPHYPFSTSFHFHFPYRG